MTIYDPLDISRNDGRRHREKPHSQYDVEFVTRGDWMTEPREVAEKRIDAEFNESKKAQLDKVFGIGE